MSDGLSTLYQDLLGGSYDCVDRILLNAYFRMGHDPSGFRVWWRALTGSDQTLENAYLMRMAGRFSRRVRGYAKAHGIRVIDCSAGERKHDMEAAGSPLAVAAWRVEVARRRAESSGLQFGEPVGGCDQARVRPPRFSGGSPCSAPRSVG